MATMFDDFNGTTLNRDNWPVLYGGEANGYSWSHDDVKVADGQLVISMTNHGGHWSAGGVSQGWAGDTYGHYEIRAKVDPGQGTGPAILLWPTSNEWPPEIDMLETPDADRSTVYFSKHWDGGGGADWYENEGYAVDATQWHTYTLDWQPNRLTYSIDGEVMYSSTEHVPDQAMSLAFMGFVAQQNDHWYNGGPDGSTPDQVNLYVDYVRISDSAGSALPAPVRDAEEAAPPPAEAPVTLPATPVEEAPATGRGTEAEAAAGAEAVPAPVSLPPTPAAGAALAGTAAVDEILGGAGEEVITGGRGNDWLVGGGGADRFVFAAGDGPDWVEDFQPGTDQIELQGFSAAEVSTQAARYFGNAGLRLDYGSNHLFLNGVSALQAGDLVFA